MVALLVSAGAAAVRQHLGQAAGNSAAFSFGTSRWSCSFSWRRSSSSTPGERASPTTRLELIRDLSARVEEANQRRNRRVEMIKMLSLHIASLRAPVTETPSEIRHLSEDVRALCEEIRRQGPAPGIGSDEMPTVPKISV